jgi:thiol-disulfide isomerase/thioredoxin
MPDFDEIAKEYEGKVVFMMVNLTDGTQETQESAQAHIDLMGYTFPVYFDKDSDAAYQYGIQSIPTTFFIDAKGNLIAYGEGAMDGDTLKRGISMIYAEKE